MASRQLLHKTLAQLRRWNTGDLQALVPVAARLVSKTGIVVASGPPDARPTALGEWVTVQDRARGRPRRFLVYRQT